MSDLYFYLVIIYKISNIKSLIKLESKGKQKEIKGERGAQVKEENTFL